MAQIEKVGVLGCGLMGHGITQVAAEAGYQVVVVEVDEATLAKGIGKIEKQLARAVEKGKATQEDADAVRAGSRALPNTASWPSAISCSRRSPRTSTASSRCGPRSTDGRARGVLRHEHVVAFGRFAGGLDQPSRAVPGAPFLQPRAGDEAARGDPRRHDLRGGDGGRACVRRAAREAVRADQGQGRFHRQPAAGPVHDRRDPRLRGGDRLDHRDRRGDEGRCRPPDGASDADPLRLRRP